MKKKVVFALTALFASSYLLSSYHNGAAHGGWDCTGAETACSGTFAGLTGCASGSGCHAPSVTSTIAVALELDSAGVATTHYVAGGSYTVKITGTNSTGTSLPKYGFQLTSITGTASAATVTQAGTFASTGLPASTQISAPYPTYTHLYVAEQSAAISVTGTTFTQSFAWTAPAAGTGTISFWGAANFVNGNTGADAGDKWNTNSLVINEWAHASGVENIVIGSSSGIKVYPNPVNDLLNLSVNGSEGNYGVMAYTLSGKVLLNESFSVPGNSSITSYDISAWPTGLYYICVLKDGSRVKAVPVVKQ